MIETDKEKLIRRYAAGEITWSSLRMRGFENYFDVLTELGKLGLRPPIAPIDRPNVESRRRERALFRQELETQDICIEIGV